MLLNLPPSPVDYKCLQRFSIFRERKNKKRKKRKKRKKEKKKEKVPATKRKKERKGASHEWHCHWRAVFVSQTAVGSCMRQGVCIDDMLRLLGIDGDKIYADDDEWLQEQGSLPVNLSEVKRG